MEQTQTKPLAEIHKVVQLNASIEKVWKAIATSEGLASWWMKNTFKPILGYDFILQTDQFGDSPCRVIEIKPPTKLCIEWDKDWQLMFELQELGPNKCELSFTHSGWDATKKTRFGQPHTVIRKAMDDGWTKIIQNTLPKKLEM